MYFYSYVHTYMDADIETDTHDIERDTHKVIDPDRDSDRDTFE